MIPLRLSVKNFMCYREDVPVLDLEGIHVACLCGDNGHGKTALLDAMTWALWGQARARTQEELVHQGQLDMAVELDFMAHDQRYRVSRRHSRSGRSKQGATILELQLLTGNGPRPITGNVMRDTQKLIGQILHMDYETFTNTAYLRQGDADRFTTSGPAKRKQTLAEVLDLSYFQGLEERARERRRTIQDKLMALQGWVDLRRQEASRRPEYERELVQVKECLSALAPGIEAQQRRVDELRRSAATLFVQRDELHSLSRRVEDGQRDLSQLEVQVRQRDEGVRSLDDVLRREVEIKERFATLAAGLMLPARGSILLSIADRSKAEAAPMIKDLASAGYALYATEGTASMIRGLGIPVTAIPKRLSESHPNVVDVIVDGTVDAVVNTVTGDRDVLQDGFHIRRAAVDRRIPCFTSLDTARAAVESIVQGDASYSVKPLHRYLAEGE